MIKLNWVVILVIIALLILLYINNSEHFAGALTIQNTEAVANISSIVNSGNLTATNITASNSLVVPGNNKITLSAADGNKMTIDATSGKLPFFINNGIDMGCYDSWRISNNGDARFNGKTVFGSTSTFNGPVSFAGATSTPAGSGDMKTHFPNVDGNNYIRGNTYVAGNMYLGGNVISQNLPVSTAKIIPMSGYQDPWYGDYYKNIMVKEFKLSDPDGKKVDFLFLFSSGDSWTAPKIPTENATVVYQRYYTAIKYGNRIYFHYLIATGSQGKDDISVVIPN